MTEKLGRSGKRSPSEWFVVFHRRSNTGWVNRLPGEFKHVSAFGFVPAERCWVYYNFGLNRTSIEVCRQGDAEIPWLATIAPDVDAAVLRIAASADARTFGVFTCVQAVKRLIGLRSGALRPDGLWRDCLAAGAERLSDG